jgi:hypothetical protein
MRSRTPRHPLAFTIIELLVVIAVIALLLSMLLPALGKSRKAARVMLCTSHMRGIGTGMMNYAMDTKGWLGCFSWKPNVAYSQWGDLNNGPSFVASHANQAVDIVRRMTGDTTQMPLPERIVARNYSYLALYDGGYFADRIPEPAVVCPDDRDAITWQRNFIDNHSNILDGTPDPDPGASPAFHHFLAFWSTYQTVPAAWSNQTGANCLQQATAPTPGYHLLYYTFQGMRFSNARMDMIAFPSSKVYMFDLFDRHKSKRTIFHAYPSAAQPLIFFDGSVAIRQTGDANRGWNPNNPNSQNPTIYYYTPTPGEPPTLSGAPSDQVLGYYRWTRKGLAGVDYGGGQVP